MRIGISPWGSSREGMIAIAAAAVDSGVDTLWLGDGLLVVQDFPPWSGGMESFSELAWLSGRYPAAGIGITPCLPCQPVGVGQNFRPGHRHQGEFVSPSGRIPATMPWVRGNPRTWCPMR